MSNHVEIFFNTEKEGKIMLRDYMETFHAISLKQNELDQIFHDFIIYDNQTNLSIHFYPKPIKEITLKLRKERDDEFKYCPPVHHVYLD